LESVLVSVLVAFWLLASVLLSVDGLLVHPSAANTR
jgi:hypothetical protein